MVVLVEEKESPDGSCCLRSEISESPDVIIVGPLGPRGSEFTVTITVVVQNVQSRTVPNVKHVVQKVAYRARIYGKQQLICDVHIGEARYNARMKQSHPDKRKFT